MRNENRCSLGTWRVPTASHPPNIPCRAEILGTRLSPDLPHPENSWWESPRPLSTQGGGSRSRLIVREVPVAKERAWELLITDFIELIPSAKPSWGVSGYSDTALGASQWFLECLGIEIGKMFPVCNTRSSREIWNRRRTFHRKKNSWPEPEKTTKYLVHIQKAKRYWRRIHKEFLCYHKPYDLWENIHVCLKN